MKYLPYIILALFGLTVGLLAGFFLLFKNNIEPITSTLNLENAAPINEVVVTEPTNTEAPTNTTPAPETAPVELPESVLLDVPFTSQAPTSNWGMPYQEACEEASLIIAYSFWEKAALTPASADAQIREMVAWENKTFGDYQDTTIEETARIAREFYGYDAKVVYDITAKDIKAELANGNPVIIPAAGRELGNPNFTPPGPWYHNLVVIGYDGDSFITNDPGTRNGKGYTYLSTTLMSAIHDWVGVKERIDEGRKAMLVIHP